MNKKRRGKCELAFFPVVCLCWKLGRVFDSDCVLLSKSVGRTGRASTLAGKAGIAGKAGKWVFFQNLAGKLENHKIFLLRWLEKLDFFPF